MVEQPADTSSDLVRIELRPHVLIMTINRPRVRNAVDESTAEQIEKAMDLLDDTPELLAGIITGAGGNFSAGADLKAAARGERNATAKRGDFGLLRRPPRKPLIAAVEGFALGGGFELCLSCDLIVAAETAQFGLPEVRHNVLALGGGLFRLPKRLPYHLAMELALTGRRCDAKFLHSWGLVNRIVPTGAAVSGSVELADALQANGPSAVAASKEIISESTSWRTEDEAWEAQAAIAARVLDPADRAEGLAAFAEKRRPVWKGR